MLKTEEYKQKVFRVIGRKRVPIIDIWGMEVGYRDEVVGERK